MNTCQIILDKVRSVDPDRVLVELAQAGLEQHIADRLPREELLVQGQPPQLHHPDLAHQVQLVRGLFQYRRVL